MPATVQSSTLRTLGLSVCLIIGFLQVRHSFRGRHQVLPCRSAVMATSAGRALTALFWGLILLLWVVFTVRFHKSSFYLFPMLLSPTALLFLWNALRQQRRDRVHPMTTTDLTLVYALGFICTFIPYVLNTTTSRVAMKMVMSGRDAKDELQQGTWRIYVFYLIAIAISPGVWEELYKWWLTSVAAKRLGRPRSRLQVTLCAVTSGLSFATAENLLYYWRVMSCEGTSLSTIMIRTLLCIPFHVACAVMSGQAISRMIDRQRHRFMVTLPGVWKQMVLHACSNYLLFLAGMPHLGFESPPGMQLVFRSLSFFIDVMVTFYVAYVFWTVDDEPFKDDTVEPKHHIVIEPPAMHAPAMPI